MSTLVLRIRLLCYLSMFAADIAALYVQKIRPLLWSLLILMALVLGAAHTYLSTLAMVKTEKIVAVSLSTTIPHSSVNLTRTQLEAELKHQQQLLAVQPQHTGVLLNISLLQKALQNQKEAFLAWEEARKLDPNNSVFSSQ